MSDSSERRALFATYVGARGNRRHRPGRAFERTDYRFEIVSDYGAFRDLQRHRMLTIEWQPLTVDLGFDVPEVVADAGPRRPLPKSRCRVPPNSLTTCAASSPSRLSTAWRWPFASAT